MYGSSLLSFITFIKSFRGLVFHLSRTRGSEVRLVSECFEHIPLIDHLSVTQLGRISNIGGHETPRKWKDDLENFVEKFWVEEFRPKFGQTWNASCNSYQFAKRLAAKLSLTWPTNLPQEWEEVIPKKIVGSKLASILKKSHIKA